MSFEGPFPVRPPTRYELEEEQLERQRDFKSFVLEMGRDPSELPSARQRALMACIVLPSEIQKWIVDAGALDPLLDSIEKTILAAEQHARGTPPR